MPLGETPSAANMRYEVTRQCSGNALKKSNLGYCILLIVFFTYRTLPQGNTAFRVGLNSTSLNLGSMEKSAHAEEICAVLSTYEKAFGCTPAVLIECGARDSLETVLFSELNSKCRIYSFECNPATLPVCRERTSRLANVELIEKAVSDNDGTVSFFATDPEKTETTWDNGNPGASSLLRANPAYPLEKYVQNEIVVATTRLDTFMTQKGLQDISVIWMDIQGAELMALKGLGNRIHSVGLIYLETEFFEIYKGQPLFRDIKKFLNHHGFQLYGFTHFGQYAGDAIFLNKKKIRPAIRFHMLFSDPFSYFHRRLKRKLSGYVARFFKR